MIVEIDPMNNTNRFPCLKNKIIEKTKMIIAKKTPSSVKPIFNLQSIFIGAGKMTKYDGKARIRTRIETVIFIEMLVLK
jgi:hypothetical protein